ncbi:MAG TPA: DUF6694 family lipoprotein [Candidatus Binatia bacterium]
MRGSFVRVCVAVVALTAAACTTSREEPRLDMSTQESAKRSMEEVRASLSKEDQQRFNQAAAALVVNAVKPPQGEAPKDPAQVQAAINAALNGKTAAEVIAAGEALQAKGQTSGQGQQPAAGAP